MGLEKKTGRILYAAVYTLSGDRGERAWCLLPELGTAGARPVGLSEGAHRHRDAATASVGRWWSASSLPAASIATGCFVFAN